MISLSLRRIVGVSSALGVLMLASACVDSGLSDTRFDTVGGESAGSEDGSETGGADESDTGEAGEDDGETSDGPPISFGPDLGGGDENSGDGDGDGDPNGGACLEFSDVLAPVPPSVLFVLDRSGSMMNAGFDPQDPGKSRWQALYESVEAVLLEGDLDTSIEIAAKTFSSKGWGACGVAPQLDVGFALENAQLLLDTIPGPNEIVNGGTPTRATVAMTLDYMRGYAAEGAKIVILITDGAIGCTDDQAGALAEIVGDLTTAREIDGIATYVIGIAPQYQSFKSQLHAMAVAGGAPDYYEATDAPALAQSLNEVVAASYANSCLLNLGEPPSAPELTVVETGGESWTEVEDCEAEDGWVWINPGLTRMRLCNAACDALLETQQANVEYHCDPG